MKKKKHVGVSAPLSVFNNFFFFYRTTTSTNLLLNITNYTCVTLSCVFICIACKQKILIFRGFIPSASFIHGGNESRRWSEHNLMYKMYFPGLCAFFFCFERIHNCIRAIIVKWQREDVEVKIKISFVMIAFQSFSVNELVDSVKREFLSQFQHSQAV